MDYAPITPAFVQHPEEGAIIGRMLAGYGELEFLLAMCMRLPLGSLSQAARLLFRTRGEEHRLKTADTILRPFYGAVGLENIWQDAWQAIKKCKDFRNQYSHCHWRDEGDLGLFFTNLEAGARTASGPIPLAFFHIDLPLLERQESYFRYAGNHLIYLEAEQRLRTGKLHIHPFLVPAKTPAPPKNNPVSEHPIRSIALDEGTPRPTPDGS